MAERVDIANMALASLGEPPISSLEDESRPALLIKTFYEHARNATLESADWSFARRRFIPALLEEPPEWGWQYAYHIPSWCLTVVTVERGYGEYRHGMRRRPTDHTIEGRRILANEEPIYCRGIEDIQEEGRFSHLFSMALSQQLASLVALPLTESNSKRQAALESFRTYLAAAKNSDGMTGTSERIRNLSLHNAR